MPTDQKLIQNQWGGLNQRIFPTLLPENTFTYTEGMVYRSGKGCRVNGKIPFYKFDSLILAILQTPTLLIVQTFTEVVSFPINEVLLQLTDLQADPNGQYITDELGNRLQPNG